MEQGQLQLGLFDERNLLELSSSDYPGERLVACRNPQLAQLRAHTRDALLEATEVNLQKIKARVDAGRLTGQDAIGLRVGKIIHQYKVAKHFELRIGDTAFSFQRHHDRIAAEAALDGIYICSVPGSPTCVRHYSRWPGGASRSLKTLKVRPICLALISSSAHWPLRGMA